MPEKKLEILYIEDSPDDAMLVEFALKKSGLLFNMLIVSSEKEFVKALTDYTPDLILSDHSLPGFNSMEAYKITRKQKPETPFVLLTGTVSEEFAVDCLLAGMDDYILKSNLIRLPSSIDRILSKRKTEEEKHVIEHLLEELQATHRQVEIKNKEIMDSINYAKRLQDAILPNDRIFDKFFQKDFIIYHPRDVVSGDFYWLARTTVVTDDRNMPLKILAAFDCTGHGIPGAFMSLLSSVLLNDAVKNSRMNFPSEALAYLNQKLPAILNRNNVEKIADGMDIALCAFDLFTRTLYFSGANRPLWIVRKNAEGILTILEYKGTKASIGAYTPFDQIFENHIIQMKTGDRVFMFTDGVTDQFGGPIGKKMGRKKLKEMILHSSAMEMTKQKKYLLKNLMEWKGNLEQVDDMLLIGIEIS
ncbi:MAG: response regulator [Bacteroidetes bacterium]|nr:response regulator [Bacteroidota bacterium]